MNEKSNYILALVAIVVVGGAFYFYNGQKPVEVVGNNSSATTSPVVTSAPEYKNTEYGFKVSLPESWRGFAVIVDNWEGYSLTDNGYTQKISETGPLIYVRHPGWTSENPRQDIPVMVFTYKQWADIDADKFHIGAAPFGPSELARNSTYVFALPARYNYAYPTGFEEVDALIQAGAVKPL